MWVRVFFEIMLQYVILEFLKVKFRILEFLKVIIYLHLVTKC